MITILNLKKLTIDSIKFTTIGEYCLKNINLVQKIQNLIVMKSKNVKDNFIALLGASGFKKR